MRELRRGQCCQQLSSGQRLIRRSEGLPLRNTGAQYSRSKLDTRVYHLSPLNSMSAHCSFILR